MARFTLIEQPVTGDEIPDPLPAPHTPRPPRNPGDDLLIIERVLVDRNGKDRGRLTVRGTIVRKIGLAGDALWSFQGNINIFEKGVINTQGVFQFSDIATGVTFAIVGGTRKYKKAHGTVTARRVDPNPTELTFQGLVGARSSPGI
jgi:hypothetical protein